MERSDEFMNWVDRTREQMESMAERAQELQYASETTWSELQRKRRYETLSTQLGEITFLQMTEAFDEERADETDRIVAEMQAIVKEDIIDLRDPSMSPTAKPA